MPHKTLCQASPCPLVAQAEECTPSTPPAADEEEEEQGGEDSMSPIRPLHGISTPTSEARTNMPSSPIMHLHTAAGGAGAALFRDHPAAARRSGSAGGDEDAELGPDLFTAAAVAAVAGRSGRRASGHSTAEAAPTPELFPTGAVKAAAAAAVARGQGSPAVSARLAATKVAEMIEQQQAPAEGAGLDAGAAGSAAAAAGGSSRPASAVASAVKYGQHAKRSARGGEEAVAEVQATPGQKLAAGGRWQRRRP